MSSFFGLRESDKSYIYEECFQCVRHCGLTFTEAWELPIEIRKWWIERTVKAKRDEAPKKTGDDDPTPKKKVDWDALNQKIMARAEKNGR